MINRGVGRFFSGLFFNHIKADSDFKQISVNENFKGSALKPCQALGNGKSKTASFGGAGYITADKTFCQFGALHI